LKFCILTHVNHKKVDNRYYAYGPYIREMNLWLNKDDELIIVAPMDEIVDLDQIDLSYEYTNIQFVRIPEIEFTSFKKSTKSLFKIPVILFRIAKGIFWSDHIHLRCPGNIGLIASFVQIFFPLKKKTSKYAGNWDPKSVQPMTYKIQRWILSNTWLTKNMQVLVYGQWQNQSKNVKPFFTASYWDKEIIKVQNKYITGKLQLVYVGSLIPSKNPMLSAKVAKSLLDLGRDVEINFYGEGSERRNLGKYILENQLTGRVMLNGNVNSETIKKAYQRAHFLIFISESEGWPKAVAEAMFWGCVPITTAVSCVPWMLDFGKGGYLVNASVIEIVNVIQQISQNDFSYRSVNAYSWSRNYTLDKFSEEVKELIK
jgi:glycosyltransferase involved in cell wall biosynthesis